MAGTNGDVELPDIKVLRQFAREKLTELLDSVRFNKLLCWCKFARI